MQRLLIDPQLVRALAEVYGRAYAAEREHGNLPAQHSATPGEARILASDACDDFMAELRRIEATLPESNR